MIHYCTNTKFRAIALRFTALLVFTLLFLFSCIAQTFTTRVSQSTIGKNQYAEVSYEVGNATNIENFQPPQYKDWIIVSGPMSSTYQSSINGQVSQRTTMTYFLQPKRSGHLIVEGAKAVINGKLVSSSNRTVEVLDKNVSTPPSNSNNAQQTDPFGNMLNDPFFAQPPVAQVQPRQDEFVDAIMLQPGESTPDKIKKNLFIKVVPSKTTCYEGEPIMATYKVYTRLDMDANVTRRPSFSGFSAYDMDEPNQPYVVEELNGKRYKSWAIRRVQLYPLQSGQLTLDPVEVDCDIRFAKGEMVANGTYDPYSQNSFTKVQYTLKSPSISITCLPLPAANRPSNFNGAVGDFSVKAGISDAKPGKEDAIHYTVEISGNGNFSMVHAPTIQWPAQTEAYDPKETENLDKSAIPISGSKVFDYVFLPHKAGQFTIPAVSFSYFDVASKSYKSVSTQPITLQVSNESKHPKENVLAEEQNWPSTFSHIAAYVLPVLALGLLIILVLSFVRKNKKQKHVDNQAEQVRHAWEKLLEEAEVKKKQMPQAEPSATSVLSEAPNPTHQHEAYMPTGALQQTTIEQANAVVHEPEEIKASTMQADTLIWQDDHSLFYKALKNDILQLLADKAGTNASKNELLHTLQQRGLDAEVLQQINALIDECDAALYSPISTATDRQNMLEEAKFLLGKL